jgi:hypothetical protein
MVKSVRKITSFPSVVFADCHRRRTPGAVSGPSPPGEVPQVEEIMPNRPAAELGDIGHGALVVVGLHPPPLATTTRVAVLAPAAGCARWINSDKTLEIDIDATACNTAWITNHRIVVLTHIIPVNTNATGFMISIGAVAGYLCRNNERSTCGITGTVPTHLAFQLRTYPLNQIPAAQNETEVMGFLAVPRCVYNDWFSSQPTPTHQNNPGNLEYCS